MRKTSLLLLMLFLPACKKSTPQPVVPTQGELGVGLDLWMSTYLKESKIGHNHFQVIPTVSGFRVQEDGYMSLAMMGVPKEISSQLTAECDSAFRMERMTFAMKTGDQHMIVDGTVSGERLVLAVDDGSGRMIQREVPWNQNTFLPQTWVAALAYGRAPMGLIWLYDPSTFSLDSARVEYRGDTTMDYMDQRVKAGKYTSVFMGATTCFYLYEGRIIRETYPMDLSFVEEGREKALTQEAGPPLDLLRTFSIQPEGKPVSRKARTIKYRLRNLEGTLDLELLGVQDLLEKGSGFVIVEVSSLDPRIVGNRLGEKLPDSMRNLYTKPTSFMQADDPRIKQLADSITRGITGETEKAEAIMRWVFGYLDKRATVTVPSAREVLDMRYGDCNEHSILYGALARASGIPTVVLAGLVWQEGRFYYHAWNASYVDGMWVGVDPIAGEFPASCGHIILKIGEIERQSEIIPVVGKLRIEVLEVK
ncbi:MAG: transglutaminase-like domain-containing protein [candidate division WOR-3 bacterium]